MSEFVVTVVDKASDPIERVVGALARMTDAMEKASGASKKIDKAQADTAKSASGLGDSFSKAAAPTKALEGIAGKLGAALNPVTLAIAAVAAAAAAAIAIVVGLGVAMVKAAQAAVQLSQARRQLVATFDVLTEGAGKKTVGALDALARKLPFSKATVHDWGKQLAAVGLQGNALEKAVFAAASSAAILGDKTGAAAAPVLQFVEEMNRAQKNMVGGFQPRVMVDGAMLDRLGKMGVSVGDISSELKMSPQHMRMFGVEARKLGEAVQQSLIRKGGNALQIMGMDWDVITTKMGEGFSSLFKGMDDVVGPFMKQVKSLFSEFYEGSTSMDVAGKVGRGVLGSILETATKATRAIHIGFLQAEIAVLKFAIKVAPTVKKLQELWKTHDGSGKLLAVLKGLGVAALVVGAGLALTAGLVLAFFAPLVAVVAAVGLAILEIPGWISSAGAAIKKWTIGASEAAGNFVKGLAKGISDGAQWVVDAVSSLADGAVRALKKTLRIDSPSKITADVGLNVSRGMSVGIDKGAPEVRDSAAAMGAGAGASTSAGARAATSSSSSSRGSLTINLGGISVTVPTAAEAMKITEERLLEVLERVAAERGFA